MTKEPNNTFLTGQFDLSQIAVIILLPLDRASSASTNESDWHTPDRSLFTPHRLIRCTGAAVWVHYEGRRRHIQLAMLKDMIYAVEREQETIAITHS